MKRAVLSISLAPLFVALFLAGLPNVLHAEAVGADASLYKGQTVKILFGWRPIKLANLRTIVTAKHLKKHLPGNAIFVFQFMPGGGGIVVANQMSHVAKRDGFTITNATSGIFSSAGLLDMTLLLSENSASSFSSHGCMQLSVEVNYGYFSTWLY